MINVQCYFLFLSMYFMYQVSYVFPVPMEIFHSVKKLPDSTDNIGIVQFLRQEITKCTESTRVKRSDSSGKFSEAAKSPMIKVVRQMLQMVRNTWAYEPIGGRHPLDPGTPYGVVYLFKTSIWDYLFPDIGHGHDNVDE